MHVIPVNSKNPFSVKPLTRRNIIPLHFLHIAVHFIEPTLLYRVIFCFVRAEGSVSHSSFFADIVVTPESSNSYPSSRVEESRWKPFW